MKGYCLMRLKCIGPNCCSTYAAWKPRYVSVCNRWWRSMSYRGTLCHTEKDTIKKIWKKYSQERNCEATVPTLTFIFLWAIHIYLWAVCLFCCRKIVGPNVGMYIDRPETHECGNWNWGCTISCQGIHKFKFLCSACTVKSSFKPDSQTSLYRSLI